MRQLLSRLLVVAVLFYPLFAQAVPNTLPDRGASTVVATAAPKPPTLNLTGYILIDAETGAILADKDSHQRMAPASLTKMMSLYIISDALAKGEISLQDKVTISENAWRTPGSRMFIREGTQVSVEDLMKGIIVASGNDATVAMAEHLAGSEGGFVSIMNQTAANLGMKNTHFTDSTGLPDDDHYSTPFDMAILARALINDFPQYYTWYKQKEFRFNDINQRNRNRLLWRDDSVDGIKTGHTDSAGFCLASSAVRNGMRLISVVMGAPDDNGRTKDSQALLNYGFRSFETHSLFGKSKALANPRVYKGVAEQIPLGLSEDFRLTIPRGQYKNLKATMSIEPNLIAPITKHQQIGEVLVSLDGKTIATRPLIALQDLPEGGLWTRIIDGVSLKFKQWFSSSDEVA